MVIPTPTKGGGDEDIVTREWASDKEYGEKSGDYRVTGHGAT